MRILLSAVVLMTMFSFNANAAECEEHENVSRVNPTELSAYQECWLDTHRPNEISGTLGSIFYLNLKGIGYVSMPVDALVKAGEEGSHGYVAAKIDAKVKQVDEAKQQEVREELIKELHFIRSEIAQLYGFVLINGHTDTTIEHIKDLVTTEIELTNYLFG